VPLDGSTNNFGTAWLALDPIVLKARLEMTVLPAPGGEPALQTGMFLLQLNFTHQAHLFSTSNFCVTEFN